MAEGTTSARAVLCCVTAYMVALKQDAPDTGDQADLDLFGRTKRPFTEAHPQTLSANAHLGGLQPQGLLETTSCQSDPAVVDGTL